MHNGSLPLSRVLVVDDDEDMRATLSDLLKHENFEPVTARDGREALDIMRKELPDVVILDVRMPGMGGMEVIREAKRFDGHTPIILLTAFGNVPSAVEAMKSGAYDYVTKPFEHGDLLAKVRQALMGNHRDELEWARLLPGSGGPVPLRKVMGSSDCIEAVFIEIERVAPTNFAVIIAGETGAGKELVARAIHLRSRRASSSFGPVDCGSIPSTLIESELFGHEKGAFTGADRTKHGKFEAAAGGTLFLDEVSNLSLSVQAKLLRALQEKQICRVGGTKLIGVDVRVLAATNEDISSMVGTGRFRRDLYHRLNEYSITVPPLRERHDDIPFLAEQFLGQTNAELGKRVEGMSEAALDLLLTYHWPGNVRELRNTVRRAVLLAETLIGPEHLNLGLARSSTSGNSASGQRSVGRLSLKEIVRHSVMRVEREVLTDALRQTGGNKSRAARMLGVDYKTLHTKVRKYGIAVSG